MSSWTGPLVELVMSFLGLNARNTKLPGLGWEDKGFENLDVSILRPDPKASIANIDLFKGNSTSEGLNFG